MYQAPIIPVVDFNGDGKVDGFEFSKVVDHWGENEPSCDIGRTPLGDGVVDVNDLIVLAEYIGKDINDPTLVAHWALDETEGAIAQDTGGTYDGAVIGTPVWHPDAGNIDGALELDGSTFVTMDHVVSPADGPFSVLAWIKGGAPGQVIISHGAGTNWLMLDPVTGALMTELMSPGRSAKVLYSDTMIDDSKWHRVGFGWDGSNRRLYVDDTLVAEDTQPGLAACSGGLHIGAAKGLEPSTFWKGLIDDVRIYNRVVKP